MVGVMVGISNYVLYIMTGKSPFSKIPQISLSAPSGDDIKRTLSGGKETVYKWTDANGKVHYSSEAPADIESAQKMEVDPNVNLIEGIELQTENTSAQPQAPTTTTTTVNTDPLSGGVYNPEAVQKLIKDAKNVQNMLNERNEASKKALEEL